MRLSAGTKQLYMGKERRLREFLLKNYEEFIDADGGIILPLSDNVTKHFLDEISKTLRPVRRKRGADDGAAAEAAASDSGPSALNGTSLSDGNEAAVPAEGRNVSMAAVGGYHSMLQDLYKRRRIVNPCSETQREYLGGYKRLVANAKQKGDMPVRTYPLLRDRPIL